jgi:ribosome-interacting GTPase 1
MFFGVPYIMQETVVILINSNGGTGRMTVKLKFTRIWDTGVYAGQNAQRTHVLNDKDIVELHFA